MIQVVYDGGNAPPPADLARQPLTGGSPRRLRSRGVREVPSAIGGGAVPGAGVWGVGADTPCEPQFRGWSAGGGACMVTAEDVPVNVLMMIVTAFTRGTLYKFPRG